MENLENKTCIYYFYLIEFKHLILKEFFMTNDLLYEIEKESIVEGRPSFRPGDTLRVDVEIKEGSKTRIQSFEGIVISKKGKGVSESFTVRKISHGVGVERVFPLNCPNIKNIIVCNKGKVRRSKLYYLRDRVGKSAKVKIDVSKSLNL